jgi:hypothetical protein
MKKLILVFSQQLIEQLIINRPEDPILFLIDLLNRDTLEGKSAYTQILLLVCLVIKSVLVVLYPYMDNTVGFMNYYTFAHSCFKHRSR